VEGPEPVSARNAREAAGVRRFWNRRVLWHTAGLVIAIALAWLLLRAYRQPEFMIDFLSLLC
jgi:hypothetical protein